MKAPASDPVTPAEAVGLLKVYFHRNGYVRVPNHDRRAASPRAYHKGYEVRLVANSQGELEAIRRLVLAAGFVPGRPFAKGRQWRLPIYGCDQVAEFLTAVGWEPDEPPVTPPPAPPSAGTPSRPRPSASPS